MNLEIIRAHKWNNFHQNYKMNNHFSIIVNRYRQNPCILHILLYYIVCNPHFHRKDNPNHKMHNNYYYNLHNFHTFFIHNLKLYFHNHIHTMNHKSNNDLNYPDIFLEDNLNIFLKNYKFHILTNKIQYSYLRYFHI